ncbi:MAG: T9SS type A sorting domain-containing protein [Bacteroidia bacterium]|nr:T9SS type A sorting domain-containing protein [Bacteroidia bacterium]
MKTKTIFICILILLCSFVHAQQFPQHDWLTFPSSIPTYPSSAPLTASYFGDTIFFVGGLNYAAFCFGTNFITPPYDSIHIDLGGNFVEVKASDVYEPACWAFISNIYHGSYDSLWSHKTYYTLDSWNTWSQCEDIDSIIGWTEHSLGHALEVVDMKLFCGASLIAANDNINHIGYLFHAHYPGTDWSHQHLTGIVVSIPGVSLPPIQKICVKDSILWVLCKDDLYNVTNNDASHSWSVTANNVSLNFVHNFNFVKDSLIDIDAYNIDTIGVISTDTVYISYNSGLNFNKAQPNVSFQNLSSIRFRHYRNNNKVSATVAGTYTWHTEGIHPLVWYIETGGLQQGIRDGIIRYNENNNLLLFTKYFYKRPQYYYDDLSQGDNWTSFWGYPEKWTSILGSSDYTITVQNFSPPPNYLPAPSTFDPTLAYNISPSTGITKFDCWIWGFEPAFSFTYNQNYYIWHPNIRAGATDPGPSGGGGYIKAGTNVTWYTPSSPPTFVQPQFAAYLYFNSQMNSFKPPSNWKIKYNDLSINQIYKNKVIKDTIITPCPWTVIPFDVSHHGENLAKIKYITAINMDMNGAYEGYFGNQKSKNGDWIGLFYHDTCIAAQMVNNTNTIADLYWPENFTWDSIGPRWYYSSHQFETTGKIFYAPATYAQHLINPSVYPLSLLFAPDNFYPVYRNYENDIVYQYNYYYGGQYFMIDSVPVIVNHDTLITDSDYFFQISPEGVWYPDSFIYSIHSKAINQMVYFMNGNNNDDIEKLNISVFPNPADNDLYIKGINEPEYSIISVTGQCLMKNKGNKVDTRLLSPGVYFCKIKTRNFKFLIIR